MKKLSLTIEGQPISQPRHRHSRYGTYDPSSKDKKRIKGTIIKNTSKFFTLDPVSIMLEFHMQRPKSHFRTGKNSHLLKKNRPLYKTTKPDIDNLVKFYLDLLSLCEVWRDDCQVITLSASKYWTNDNPCTQITIYKV